MTTKFKNISIGGGLALLACSLFANAAMAFISSISSHAYANNQNSSEPTIIWYGVSSPLPYVEPTDRYNTLSLPRVGYVFRAWSDGRIEAKAFFPKGFFGIDCEDPFEKNCGWSKFSPTPVEEMNARLNQTPRIKMPIDK